MQEENAGDKQRKQLMKKKNGARGVIYVKIRCNNNW